MKIKILFLFLILFCSCTNKRVEKYDNGVIKKETVKKSGEVQVREFDKNGLLKKHILRDTKGEVVTLFFPSGKIKAKDVISGKNRENLSAQRWYENGKLASSLFYLKGKKEGAAKEWDKEGNLIFLRNYKNDNLDGEYQKFENGKIKISGSYKKDKEEGKWEFYNNGLLTHEINYLKGKKEGIEIHYYKNKKKSMEVNYKDGLADGKWIEWYENGKKSLEIHYKKGILDGSYSEWFDTGELDFTCIYKDGKRYNGIFKEYDKDGNLKYQEKVKNFKIIYKKKY